MVSALGAHSPKLDAVCDLLTARGRREQGRFAFEGPTLLGEALRSGLPVEAIYATEPAYERLEPGLREALDCPVYVIAPKSLRRISDLETPRGSSPSHPLACSQPRNSWWGRRPPCYWPG